MDNALDNALKAVAKGDVEALHHLYSELRVPVFSVALSIVRNKSSAEEVVQETFVRVYTKAGMYIQGTNAKAWVISIARNLAYNFLRRDNRRNEEYLEGFADTQTPAVDSEMDILGRIEITDALFVLDPIDREIVVMHVVAGLKHSEISAQLGLPSGTVRWKYRQALKQLSYLIGGEHR